MFYTTESSSQRNDCSLTNFTKNKPSILDCKRFIREKCAAGYLSRDSTMTPVPSGDDTSERCGICNKTMEDLKNMMREKYGDDWENELKAEYRDPIKTVLHDLKRNKMIESRKKKEFNFQAKFEESLKYDEKIIGNNSKKNGPQIQIFITEPKEVKLVSTPDRHFAVFANEIIRAFTKFGPFQGEPRTAVKNSDSYWQYTGSNNQKTIIDGQNCFKSNWMSRIRKNRTEANCVAYVSNDEIYYVALMDITKGEEIIVHEDIFTRNNENNGSDDKPDDDKDVPDDGSVEKSDEDDNGDDGGDDGDDGNNNDDVESSSSSSERDDGSGAPDNGTESVLTESEASAATPGQQQLLQPLVEYIDDPNVRNDVDEIYSRINTQQVASLVNGRRLDWVDHYRQHTSPKLKREFKRELRVANEFQADYDPKLQALIAISRKKARHRLKLVDLYSLWTGSPTEWVNYGCMRYYTGVQIDMFGLADKCCVLPFDKIADVNKFENRPRLLYEEFYSIRTEVMLNSEYVVGGFNINNHWISVFARKNDDKIYINDPMGTDYSRDLTYVKGARQQEKINGGTVQDKFGIEIKFKIESLQSKLGKLASSQDKTEATKIQVVLVLQQFFHENDWGIREVTSLRRDRQQDTYNCGVYTMEYNEHFLRQVKAHENAKKTNPEHIFQLPDRLTINNDYMRAGLYRWKIAEIMLLDSVRINQKSFCSRHKFKGEDGKTLDEIYQPMELDKQNSPESFKRIKFVKDQGQTMQCGTCEKSYHPECISNDDDCVCGNELQTIQPIYFETPKGLTPKPEKRSRTPSAQKIENEKKKQRTGEKPSSTSAVKTTPVRNTNQQNRSGSKTTSGKRKGAASSENQGSSSKIQKVDQVSNASVKTSPNRPGSRKSSKNRQGNSSTKNSKVARKLFKE